MSNIKQFDAENFTLSNNAKTVSDFKENNWKKTLISEKSSIECAISSLDKAGMQILLVVSDSRELIGTITDGDIRRGLLRGLELKNSIEALVNKNAFVVPISMDNEIIIKIMSANGIKQIPVVNENRKVVGLHTWDNLTVKAELSNPMVIMAGGIGSRLKPYTENCPKPLLSIYGKPIMEHILVRAISEGFSKFYVSVNYLAHMIEDYFGNGRKWGVDIEYIHENKPLGTAGSLSYLKPKIDSPFIVTNGDVLTHMRYSEFLDFHLNHHAEATMAVRIHEWQNPFGVVNVQGLDIVGLEEKPIDKSHINAGIYVLEPRVFRYLKPEKRCDMPSLFDTIRNSGNRTVAYPMHEPWLDVGRPDDFKLAENYVEEANEKSV
tara:strand:+ start:792 stop:1925 length:1134 start_codon:yes stop_codon:yes gene_type:complete